MRSFSGYLRERNLLRERRLGQRAALFEKRRSLLHVGCAARRPNHCDPVRAGTTSGEKIALIWPGTNLCVRLELCATAALRHSGAHGATGVGIRPAVRPTPQHLAPPGRKTRFEPRLIPIMKHNRNLNPEIFYLNKNHRKLMKSAINEKRNFLVIKLQII